MTNRTTHRPIVPASPPPADGDAAVDAAVGGAGSASAPLVDRASLIVGATRVDAERVSGPPDTSISEIVSPADSDSGKGAVGRRSGSRLGRLMPPALRRNNDTPDARTPVRPGGDGGDGETPSGRSRRPLVGTPARPGAGEPAAEVAGGPSKTRAALMTAAGAGTGAAAGTSAMTSSESESDESTSRAEQAATTATSTVVQGAGVPKPVADMVATKAVTKAKKRARLIKSLAVALVLGVLGSTVATSMMDDAANGDPGFQPAMSETAMADFEATETTPAMSETAMADFEATETTPAVSREVIDAYVAAGAAHRVPWTLLAAIGKVATDHGRRDPFNPEFAPGDPIGVSGAGNGVFLISSTVDDGPADPFDVTSSAFWLAQRIAAERLTVLETEDFGEIDPFTPEGMDLVYATVLSKLPLAIQGGAATIGAQLPPGEVARVLVIGDSLTVGASEFGGLVDAVTAASLPTPIVDALEGRSITQGFEVLSALQPRAGDLIVFALGTNDGGDADTVTARVTELMTIAGDARVAWVNVDMPAWTADGAGNDALAAAAETRSNLVVLDWASKAAQNPDWKAADGVHYNSTGYQARAEFYASQAKAAVSAGATSLPTTSLPPTAGATMPVAGASGPAPATVTQLKVSEVGWGGYTNGHIPASALAYSRRTCSGHPLAVAAWLELDAAATAAGLNAKGCMYRSYDNQVKLSTGMGATPGKSNHGWGLAIDVDQLVPGQTKEYRGLKNSEMYETPLYKWLWENAPKYGFCHPDWAQPNGSKPEAWHWEYCAIYNHLDTGKRWEIPAMQPGGGAGNQIVLWARHFGGLVPGDDRPLDDISAGWTPPGAFTGDKSDVAAIIRAIFPPEQAQNAIKIAEAESGLRPEVDNRGRNRNGSIDWGLFQFNDGSPAAHRRCGSNFAACAGTLQQMYFRARASDDPARYLNSMNTPELNSLDELRQLALDPEWSTRAAAQLWHEGGGGLNGWRPWCSASKVLGIDDVC